MSQTIEPTETQMAIADFALVDHPASSPVAGLAGAVRGWFAARRAERTQHAALQSLLFAPEHRLRDLGIRREELIQAMEIHRK
jgi:hypothetical protein